MGVAYDVGRSQNTCCAFHFRLRVGPLWNWLDGLEALCNPLCTTVYQSHVVWRVLLRSVAGVRLSHVRLLHNCIVLVQLDRRKTCSHQLLPLLNELLLREPDLLFLLQGCGLLLLPLEVKAGSESAEHFVVSPGGCLFTLSLLESEPLLLLLLPLLFPLLHLLELFVKHSMCLREGLLLLLNLLGFGQARDFGTTCGRAIRKSLVEAVGVFDHEVSTGLLLHELGLHVPLLEHLVLGVDVVQQGQLEVRVGRVVHDVLAEKPDGLLLLWGHFGRVAVLQEVAYGMVNILSKRVLVRLRGASVIQALVYLRQPDDLVPDSLEEGIGGDGVLQQGHNVPVADTGVEQGGLVVDLLHDFTGLDVLLCTLWLHEILITLKIHRDRLKERKIAQKLKGLSGVPGSSRRAFRAGNRLVARRGT